MGVPFDAPGSSRVLAAIIDGPLTRQREAAALASCGWAPAREGPTHTPASSPGLVGAMVRFEGIVRRKEPRIVSPADGGDGAAEPGAGESDLLALDYQTYDPMAERGLLDLARDVADRHGLIALAAIHSRGRVHVGEVSFVLIVESVHRAEGLAAMVDFLDRLKQDVPIWKRQVWR